MAADFQLRIVRDFGFIGTTFEACDVCQAQTRGYFFSYGAF